MTRTKEFELVVKNTMTGTMTVATKGTDKAMLDAVAENGNALNNGLKWTVRPVMNQHEKQVDRLISRSISEWIGGYENTLTDYPEDSEEYTLAKEILSDHDALVTVIYSDVMDDSRSNYASHIRFAGKQFILDRIESRLAKIGY